MDAQSIIREELQSAAEVLTGFLEDSENINAIERAADIIASSIKAGGKVFSCGNGGSMCDALHFAEEMTGRFREDRDPLPAIAIADPAHMSCVSNDFGYTRVFSRYLRALGHKGDVLLAISTSGNSDNIITAAEIAQQKSIKVIGLTGKSGGKLAEYCDVAIKVPHEGYSDRIQEVHIKVIHILIHLVEQMN